MNRKTVAVVLALIIVGAGITLILFPPSSESFHYRAQFPEGDYTRVSLWLTDIQDCTLNVSFTDDPELLYNIDVQLYGSHPEASAFELTVSDFGENSHLLEVRFEGKLSIRSLHVVLGSGVPYEIIVPSSSDMNATFTYGNNAVGSDASLFYSATGSIVSLIFTEDMVFSETGMEVICGADSRPDYIYLYTDLPDGVSGGATFKEPLYLQSSTGWAYHSRFADEVTYVTDPLKPEPLLSFGIRAVYGIYAWLSD